MNDILRFPTNFMWGTSVAAHQVEGGNTRNDWWLWEQTPGHIQNGDTADVAADWWHRAEDDLLLARQLHTNAIRFSVEWSRIEPRDNVWDDAALAHYRALIESMGRLGLEPILCLHHFTLPQWVAGRGGFETGWAVDRFARFVERVVDAYGDLVRWWLTINEPMIFTAMGWVLGRWPPGKKNVSLAFKVARNLVRAHAAAYHIIHRKVPGALVSAANHLAVFPAYNSARPLDRLAATTRDWMLNQVWVRATLDGVLRPPLGWNSRLPDAVGTHDYLALQHYFTFPIAFALREPGNLFARDMGEPGPDIPPFMGESRPEGLHDRVMWLKQFDLPIVISEHGLLENNEKRRPAYMLESLAGLHRAIRDGANVRGYFHWSLVDNFEWAEGYSARFGLIHLDLATQARTVKPSGYLYSDIAETNGITREMVEKVSPALLQRVFDGKEAR
ncbi:MAG: glycoside hydrolase family 1 protein [Anaerolineae bacterium]